MIYLMNDAKIWEQRIQMTKKIFWSKSSQWPWEWSIMWQLLLFRMALITSKSFMFGSKVSLSICKSSSLTMRLLCPLLYLEWQTPQCLWKKMDLQVTWWPFLILLTFTIRSSSDLERKYYLSRIVCFLMFSSSTTWITKTSSNQSC